MRRSQAQCQPLVVEFNRGASRYAEIVAEHVARLIKRRYREISRQMNRGCWQCRKPFFTIFEDVAPELIEMPVVEDVRPAERPQLRLVRVLCNTCAESHTPV